MCFNYKGYTDLLNLLSNCGYSFANYHNYADYDRCVVLRHDIDQSLSKVLPIAEIEAEQGIQSTYFVMLSCDFYNVVSASSREVLFKILKYGHEIGLHFDEVAYGNISLDECVEKILMEKNILSILLEQEVTTVSMHRPSKRTLEADLKIPGMINAYGHAFFHDFKYLSDARRRWREPAEEIISSGVYDRLHITTHPFWYNYVEEGISEAVSSFINNANKERYEQMSRNITDLKIIMDKNILENEKF